MYTAHYDLIMLTFRRRTLYDTIVHVYVSDSEKEFPIHKGLLCESSEVFQAVLKGLNSEEGVILEPDTGTLYVGEVEPFVFQRFMHWLYAKRICLGNENVKDVPWSIVIDLYIFATKRAIPLLQNTCIDVTIKKQRLGKVFPSQDNINRLWSGRTNVSQLRLLFLHLFARQCDLSTAIAKNGHFHPLFLQGLVSTLYNMKRAKSLYDDVDFFAQRQQYYVNVQTNPVILD